MFAKALRNQSQVRALGALQMRGGHGWPAPDVPVNRVAKAKRQWSMFENGLWLHCGSQPEFVFENREEWFKRFGSLPKQAFGPIFAIFGVASIMGIVFYILMPGYVPNIPADHANNHPSIKIYNYHIREQPAHKKDFLGTSMTGKDGSYKIKYDKLGGCHQVQTRFHAVAVQHNEILKEVQIWVEDAKAKALVKAKAQLHSGHHH
jgi:hypothetical protein